MHSARSLKTSRRQLLFTSHTTISLRLTAHSNALPQWPQGLRKVSNGWRFSRGGIVTYIEELQEAIRHRYHVEPIYVETIPVHEQFQGQTVWEGEVEVFDLPDLTDANRVYAWAYETDQVDEPKRTVTVLHV